MKPFFTLHSVAFLSVLLVLVLSGCASSVPPVEQKPLSQIYLPSYALQVLQTHLGISTCTSASVLSCGPFHTPSVQVSLNKIIIDNIYTYDLDTLKLTVEDSSWPSNAVYIIFNDGMAIVVNMNSKVREADNAVLALRSLKYFAILNRQEIGPESDAAFAAAAAKFRAGSQKPEIPEDARKYNIQANDYIQNKHLPEAAVGYCQALLVDPAWPAAHFNRALVLAEMGEYGFAVREMKRYLALTPDASDAAAVQKKIYQWEAHTAE
jgi:hypothetical protein